jgi:hypothetical protein
MGEGIQGLLSLIGKGIIGLTTGQNATGSDDEQKMVQGVLGSVANTKSTSLNEYEYYKNSGGGGNYSEFLNQPKTAAEPIPSGINVMRRGLGKPQDQQTNLGLGGVTPQASNIQDQMLQYGAGNANPFQRGEALSSLNVSDQARNEIAQFLPQMSIDQQEAFLQGVRDGKVSEYELENQSRLRY